MTSVNDMPADIVEAAAEIVDRINFVVVDPASVREDIARAILAERQRDQWQDIATAPKDGTKILLTNAGEGMIVDLGYYVEPEYRQPHEPPLTKWWRCGRGHGYGMQPTHWMPIPAAPKGGA